MRLAGFPAAKAHAASHSPAEGCRSDSSRAPPVSAGGKKGASTVNLVAWIAAGGNPVGREKRVSALRCRRDALLNPLQAIKNRGMRLSLTTAPDSQSMM
jgi:hypothetical protein